MSRALSYADAVRVLGGRSPNKVVAALDHLAGGALLALSATGSSRRAAGSGTISRTGTRASARSAYEARSTVPAAVTTPERGR